MAKKNEKNVEYGRLRPIERVRQFIENRYEIRKNTVSGQIEVRAVNSAEPFQIINEFQLLYQLYDEGGFNKCTDYLKVYLGAKVPEYDPFRFYFESLPKWDKNTDPDYITELADFVETDDQVWFRRMFKKFMLRCVAQSLGDRFNKQCFCFVGKQNDGKTSFWESLIPKSLRDYYKTGYDFSKQSKEGKIALVSSFIINLDELAQFSKHDLNAEFKSVLSESSVKFRPLYERQERPYKRRASFVATTNHPEFLTDETGNVRWLPFRVKKINHDYGGPNGYSQRVDIDKVWAQAYTMYLLKEPSEMTLDEIQHQEALNRKNFFRMTHEMEIIRSLYKPSRKNTDGSKFVQAKTLVEEIRTQTSFNTTPEKVGRALASLEFERERNELGLYGYYVVRVGAHSDETSF